MHSFNFFWLFESLRTRKYTGSCWIEREASAIHFKLICMFNAINISQIRSLFKRYFGLNVKTNKRRWLKGKKINKTKIKCKFSSIKKKKEVQQFKVNYF